MKINLDKIKKYLSRGEPENISKLEVDDLKLEQLDSPKKESFLKKIYFKFKIKF